MLKRRTIRPAIFTRAVLATAAGIAMTATGVACLTVAPPALPEQGPVRPTILHDAVVPTAGVPLAEWPVDNQFFVPVEVDAPDESFFYDVFIDYDPTTNSGNVIPPTPQPPSPATADGGITVVSFMLDTPDPRFCHTIEFLVAHSFNQKSAHTPDSLGGDIVTWFYTAGGGPNGCPAYDAGAFQSGAFPPDADTDFDGGAAPEPSSGP
jgi:hypothetical protein